MTYRPKSLHEFHFATVILQKKKLGNVLENGQNIIPKRCGSVNVSLNVR